MQAAAPARPSSSAPRRQANLARLLRPRSIAFVGGARMEVPIRSCESIGFAGDIWLVNRSGHGVAGYEAYRSLADLPSPPDAVFLGIPAAQTAAALRALDAMGAGGVVCFAAGFKEIGEEGGKLQDDLAAAAGDLAVLGPNCYGLLNYLDGAALWADIHRPERVDSGVAIVSQSGNVALNMIMTARLVPLAQVISVGNQAVLEIGDFIEPLLDDPRIKAIGLFMEGLGDVAAFSRAAERALAKGVPIVVLKVGSSEVAAQVAKSHTAALAGEERLYEVLFERLGVVRAPSLSAFMETLKFFGLHGPFGGSRLGVLTCSGGDAELVADAAAPLGLSIPPLSDGQAAAMAAEVTAFTTVANPFDYNTAIWGDQAALTACFTALLDGDMDAAVLVLDFPRTENPKLEYWNASLDALIAAAKATGKLGVVLGSFAELLPEDAQRRAIAGGLVPLQGLDDGIFALGAAATYWRFLTERQALARAGALALPDPVPLREGVGRRQLDEWGSKQKLEACGLARPRGRLVTAEEAPGAAAALGFPVVVKAVSDKLAHKSEVGAVALNLTSETGVEAAVQSMSALSDRFLVEAMVQDAVAELIVGVKRDPQFGLALVIGSGGVLVELIEDSATLLLPCDRKSVERALAGLKADRLLAGFRGKPAGDRAAAIDAILAVADFALAESGCLIELDVNPLMVRPVGSGAVAADALIVMAEG